MLYRAPQYARNFRCAAQACRDSCCIGWEIPVDEGSIRRYQNMQGPLGASIRESITEDGCFHLGDKERCPHLLKSGLCRIILEAGEDALCDICREHPRFYNRLNSACEWGVGLSCESAARLILCDEQTHALTEEVRAPKDEDPAEETALETLLFNEREALSRLIFDKKVNFDQRLLHIEKRAEALQDFIDFKDISKEEFTFCHKNDKKERFLTEERIEKYKRILSSLDVLYESFPARCKLIEAPKEFPEDTRFFERIFSYFLYRYFITAAEDGDVLGKIGLALFSTLMILALCESEGRKTLEDVAQAAKDFSKEIEYSEENVAAVEDAFSAFG